MTIKLDNPEMREIFETKFHSNQEEFMKCILSFIQDNKKLIRVYLLKVTRKILFDVERKQPQQ